MLLSLNADSEDIAQTSATSARSFSFREESPTVVRAKTLSKSTSCSGRNALWIYDLTKEDVGGGGGGGGFNKRHCSANSQPMQCDIVLLSNTPPYDEPGMPGLYVVQYSVTS